MSDAVFCEEAENLRKLHLELNRRLLQDGIFLSAELRQLFIQLFVDPLPEPRLAGRGNGVLWRKPADPAVFIRLGTDGGGGICLQQIGDVQVKVGRYVNAPFFVSVHCPEIN